MKLAKGAALALLFYGIAFLVWGGIYGNDYATAQEIVNGAPTLLLVGIAGFFTWLTMKTKR